MIAENPLENLILDRGAEPDEIPNRSASPFGLTKPTEGRSVSHSTFRSWARIPMMRIYNGIWWVLTMETWLQKETWWNKYRTTSFTKHFSKIMSDTVFTSKSQTLVIWQCFRFPAFSFIGQATTLMQSFSCWIKCAESEHSKHSKATKWYKTPLNHI